MGVSLLGVLPSKFTLERWLGGPFRLAAPLRARLLPAEGGLRDLAFGLLWGLLPCGLVYGALALSMASGTPLRGALVMLTFGLGTVPALTLVSLLAQKLGRWAAHPQARLAVGLVMLTMGLVQLHRVTFAAPPECCTTDTASAGLALSRSSSSHGSLPAVLPLTPP
jgi:sulfite exporter TauE/SafE